MGQNEIINQFFEYPTKDFQIRGIAKELRISKTAVSYHIHKLLKEKIIIKHENGVFPSFRANESGEIYRFLKLQSALKDIITCGILDYLDKLNPKCIYLFGSFAKSEYNNKSDIDIFVQAPEQTVNLGKFEKKLNHKVNILFEKDINKLSANLLNNIINGIKLRGFLKLKT